MRSTQFKTKILSFGQNTGIEVPQTHLLELGESKKPPVHVDLNGYQFSSTIAKMKDQFLISFSKEHRQKSGFKGGDEVMVTLTLIEGKREVQIPDEINQLLSSLNLLSTFEAQSYSSKKEFIRKIVEAKKEATKHKRIEDLIHFLNAKQGPQ